MLYGTAQEFVHAPEYNYDEVYQILEEACITYESALTFEPSAEVILRSMSDLMDRDYVDEMQKVDPATAARFAIIEGIRSIKT